MTKWYEEIPEFNIKSSAEDGEKGAAFLTDGSDKVMLELVKIPDVSTLIERMNYRLQLHIALKSLDPDEEAEYLVSKGAIFIEKCPIE
jgi:hypothetical protein